VSTSINRLSDYQVVPLRLSGASILWGRTDHYASLKLGAEEMKKNTGSTNDYTIFRQLNITKIV